MTPKELLKPRYKVIAIFPLMCVALGEVLASQRNHAHVLEGGYWMVDLAAYPHLFRPLAWWEEREEKDMREVRFLKDIGDGEVFQSECTNNGTCFVKPNNKADGDLRYTNIQHFTPATAEDYLSFISK